MLCFVARFISCPRSSLQFDKGQGRRGLQEAAKERTLDFLAGHRRKTAIPDSESEVVVDGGCEGDLTGDAVHSCEENNLSLQLLSSLWLIFSLLIESGVFQ